MKKIITMFAIAAMTVSGAALAGDVTGDVTATAEGASAGAAANNNSSTNYNGFSASEVQDMIDNAREDGAATRGETTQRINYSGEYDLNNVPNVTAPGLTTTLTETCMGSTSGGAAASGWGFSIGSTWRDSACVRRLDARQLQALGYTLGAKELMCDGDAVRAALKRAGKPCYLDLPVEAMREEDRVVPVAVPVEETPALGYSKPSVWDFQTGG